MVSVGTLDAKQACGNRGSLWIHRWAVALLLGSSGAVAGDPGAPGVVRLLDVGTYWCSGCSRASHEADACGTARENIMCLCISL